ncbi:aspartate 1-decarboxylase autocleavage activator PanM [Providencia sneebia]|uniref:PanD regulatory factor n=1 Tax=Providencia sneebia DSM 19967 TaxID=1141660 RepID=K8WH96_9GAMM|nr:aspartate 1-decarboxylase autocleavage activator PanM [Providencia sneebia]EKT59933.1 hypothetical protein OO7_03844 [Providencia sneebia DSM 19967]
MRLTITPLSDLTNQHILDLSKIWPNHSQEHLEQWLKSGGNIYAASFNGRLLGAAKVRIEQQQGMISDFFVREVTRRRGVGLYLVEEICRQNSHINNWNMNLQNISDENKTIMVLFLSSCGFHVAPNSHKWEKQT